MRNSLRAHALQPQILPNRINPCHHIRIARDRRAPLARGFARPFVGGVDAHFAARAGDGAGEIEIIDGGVFHDQGIARGIDAGGERPDHKTAINSSGEMSAWRRRPASVPTLTSPCIGTTRLLNHAA